SVIKSMDLEQVPVPYTKIVSITDLHFKKMPNENFAHARVFVDAPEGTPLGGTMHGMPFDLSAFPNVGPAFRAPLLGEHTDSILRDGWSSRNDNAVSFGNEPRSTRPFEGIQVWEWADTENIVPQV